MTIEMQRPKDVNEGGKSFSPTPSFKPLTSADSQIVKAMSAPGVINHGGMLDHNPLEQGGAKLEKTILSIAPCTPKGEDPMKDPANPKSPNFDKKFAPQPAKPMGVPKDGIINPESPTFGKQLMQAPIGAYEGMCDDPKNKTPPVDVDKIPMW